MGCPISCYDLGLLSRVANFSPVYKNTSLYLSSQSHVIEGLIGGGDPHKIAVHAHDSMSTQKEDSYKVVTLYGGSGDRAADKQHEVPPPSSSIIICREDGTFSPKEQSSLGQDL